MVAPQPHRLPGPPVAATLLERENRFLARCSLPSGEVVHAHVPDRGRLEGVLVPGARVLLFRAPEAATRRTTWSLLACEEPSTGVLVAIDPAGANARVRPLLEAGAIAAIGAGWAVRAEVRHGGSRFDFELTRGTDRLLVEVKSVGVVRDGTALFPDAPTLRGTRHLEELAAFASSGAGRAAVVFVAQRGDARRVAAFGEIDPVFAETLERVRPQLVLAAVAFDVRPEGLHYLGEIPVV